jgi:hypothetical protein
MSFLWNSKGYVLHLAVVAVAFLDPSVQAFFAHNPLYAMVGLAVWGSILHWANGKLSVPATAGKIMGAFLAVSFLGLSVMGCSATQSAQKFSQVFAGILNVAQADEPALSPADAAIVNHWVTLGQTLDGQLNTCIGTTGGNKAKIAGCITSFGSGLTNSAELAQLRILSPSAQTKIQIVATAVTLAVNAALTQFGGTSQPAPAIAPTLATAAELHMLSAQLVAEGYQLQ